MQQIAPEQIQPWLADAPPLIDVRTPAEFAEGHIPGARNLPLFSNEERAEVGTLYKQVSPNKAFLRGLEFAGKRLRSYVEKGRKISRGGRIDIHCWRGGQRSGSMAWLLTTAGLDVQVLTGGYKAWRGYIRRRLAEPKPNFIILGGHTGSGKTHILHALREQGEIIVDLEGLANHKGSAFGSLGEAPQPTVEQFENDLYADWSQKENAGRIWLENESAAIGRVYLPQPFFERMNAAPLVHLEMPQSWRVQNLVADYADFDSEQLAESFRRITKRLGGQHVKAALAALEQNDYATAAGIALQYYDKAYAHMLERRGERDFHHLEAVDRDPARVAEQLRQWADKNA